MRLAREGLEQEPALIQGASRNRDCFAPQPGKVLDGRCRFDHDGTKRRRIRNEDKPATQISLPRDPQPVAEDDVGRPAQKSDFRGFGRGKFGHFKVEAGFLVESSRADDREFPAESSGFLHRETELIRGNCFAVEKDSQHEVKRRPAKPAREGTAVVSARRFGVHFVDAKARWQATAPAWVVICHRLRIHVLSRGPIRIIR